MTNTYDASFGDFRGGAVNTTIKSGSQRLARQRYEFYRTTSWMPIHSRATARASRACSTTSTSSAASTADPIRKDKDFVLVSFEGWQEMVPFPINVVTPPMALRDGQHFSDYGMQIFDPLTTHPCTAGSGAASTEPCSGSFGSAFWRNPFPGNVIPQSRISPAGEKILSYYPTETVPGQLLQNYVSSNTGRYYYNQPMVRFDHNFGVNDKFYAMFTGQDGYEYRANFPKPGAAPGNVDNKRTFTNVILNYTRVLSSTHACSTSAHRITASCKRRPATTTRRSSCRRSKDFGMTQMVHPPTSPGDIVPGFTVGGYGQVLGNGSPLGTWTPETTFNVAPSFNLTRGVAQYPRRVRLQVPHRANGATGNSEGNLHVCVGADPPGHRPLVEQHRPVQRHRQRVAGHSDRRNHRI